jgi:hypothetical protein
MNDLPRPNDHEGNSMNSKSLITTGGKALFALTALLASQVALAEHRAGACNNCSSADMKRLAMRLVSNGTASIFDGPGSRIETYRVFTTTIEGRTGRTWRSAALIQTDPVLKRAWNDFIDSVDGLGHGGVIQLPPDFPVRSVAGALLDPSYATTAIENHIAGLPGETQLQITMGTLGGVLTDVKTPFLDMESIIGSVHLTVEFPDGSTMDFTLEFSANQLSLRARTELNPAGNATLADGSPAPTSALGFRDRSFQDNGGSLVEWLLLARSYGVPIVGSGSGDGTTMECKVEGSTITCRVKKSDR